MRMDSLLGIPLGSEPVCDEIVIFEGGRELAVKSIREIGKVNTGWSIKTEENKERVYRRDYTKVDSAPVLQFGQKGAKNGCFQYPYSVAVNSRDEIVVADTKNHRIQVFDGSKGRRKGLFNVPYCVTFDPRNHQIVVADTRNHRIQIFDEKGTFIRAFGSKGKGNGQLEFPRGVAMSKEGGYVVSSEHCIQVFDSAGNFVRKFGSQGNGDGQLLLPVGVGILSTGNVVVGDWGNHKSQIFDPQGNFVCVFGVGIVSFPRWVFVDSDDNILVACSGAIEVFKSDGTHLKAIGQGVISSASDVCMVRNGRIVVSGSVKQKVIIF